MGRKVPTLFSTCHLNSLFQSAGVICAKRAMVIHYGKLKGEGGIVDFLRMIGQIQKVLSAADCLSRRGPVRGQ